MSEKEFRTFRRTNPPENLETCEIYYQLDYSAVPVNFDPLKIEEEAQIKRNSEKERPLLLRNIVIFASVTSVIIIILLIGK